jgi:hypothetical protein
MEKAAYLANKMSNRSYTRCCSSCAGDCCSPSTCVAAARLQFSAGRIDTCYQIQTLPAAKLQPTSSGSGGEQSLRVGNERLKSARLSSGSIGGLRDGGSSAGEVSGQLGRQIRWGRRGDDGGGSVCEYSEQSLAAHAKLDFFHVLFRMTQICPTWGRCLVHAKENIGRMLLCNIHWSAHLGHPHPIKVNLDANVFYISCWRCSFKVA